MSLMAMSEFLRALYNSGRFQLLPEGEGWEITWRPTSGGRPRHLDWAWDHKKGLEVRVRMYGSSRLVSRFDLAFTLYHGKPPTEALFPKNGDWRDPDPRNLVNLKSFREGYSWERPSVGEYQRKISPGDWENLAYMRDRYFPAPIPPEVFANYPCCVAYLKRRLKQIPVKPLSTEQERLMYIPDRRPRKYRGIEGTPDKTLPKSLKALRP